MIRVARRIEMRIAHHPAERPALVLVNIADASPASIFGKVGVASATFVQLTAQVNRDGALAILKWSNGPKINRAGKPHARNAGVGSLVDNHGPHELRGILVKLYRS